MPADPLAAQVVALARQVGDLETKLAVAEAVCDFWRRSYEYEVHVAAHLGAQIVELTGRFPDLAAIRRSVAECLAVRDAEQVVREAHDRIRHPSTSGGSDVD